jgi:atypical dual specificity phosphatase
MNAKFKSIIFISGLFFQFIYCAKPVMAHVSEPILVPVPALVSALVPAPASALVSAPVPAPIPKILSEKRFSWIVPNVIAGMAMPTSKDQIAALHDLNIGLVVTLTEPKEGPNPKIFNRVDIERLILPTHDNRAPTIEQVDKFIKKFKEQPKGKTTVVHCRHGQGRTGTMLACWLMVNYNMKPHEAIKLVRKMRHGSVCSIAQRRFVSKYYDTLIKRKLIVLPETINL